MKHEEKLIAIFQGVDFLLLIALPLRRPPSFEKVSKLRRNIPDMQKAERLDGTIDVINKLGYTVVTRDHFEFPQEIHEAPDQVKSSENDFTRNIFSYTLFTLKIQKFLCTVTAIESFISVCILFYYSDYLYSKNEILFIISRCTNMRYSLAVILTTQLMILFFRILFVK